SSKKRSCSCGRRSASGRKSAVRPSRALEGFRIASNSKVRFNKETTRAMSMPKMAISADLAAASTADDLQPMFSFLGIPGVISSARMRAVLRSVERSAKSNAAVLITGESGCGKEVIARAVHEYSPRAARPWIDINCAALPDHLLESELFGYEKGAFSGADTA